MIKKVMLITVVLLVNSILLAANISSKEAQELYKEAEALVETDSIDHSKDKHELGIKKFEQLINLDPTYYEAYVGFAKAYRSYGMFFTKEKSEERYFAKKKEKELLEKAIQIAPKRPEAYHRYLYLVRGAERENIKKKLYELNPSHPDVMIMKGHDLIAEGKITEGIDSVLKGIDSSPGEGSATAEIDRLEKHLKQKGYEKESTGVTDWIKRKEKFYRGVGEINQGNTDKGLKMVKEATNGDYTTLSLKQKDYFAETLENKKMYKEAADIYELMDRDKYKEKITTLRQKGKTSK